MERLFPPGAWRSFVSAHCVRCAQDDRGGAALLGRSSWVVRAVCCGVGRPLDDGNTDRVWEAEMKDISGRYVRYTAGKLRLVIDIFI